MLPSARLSVPIGDLDPVERRAAGRRRADALPRGQARAARPAARLDRGRHRRRRPRPRRRPVAARAERLPDRGGRPPPGGARRGGRRGRRRGAAGRRARRRRTSARAAGGRGAGAGASTASASTRRSSWRPRASRRAGTSPILGVGGGTLPFRFGAIPFETSVIFSNWGTRAELAEVVELARAGVIQHRGRARARSRRCPPRTSGSRPATSAAAWSPFPDGRTRDEPGGQGGRGHRRRSRASAARSALRLAARGRPRRGARHPRRRPPTRRWSSPAATASRSCAT